MQPANAPESTDTHRSADWQTTYSLSAVAELAENLLKRYPKHRVFLLEGELGAGKTTLVRALVGVLGAPMQATSPTFTLLQTYAGNTLPLHHIDAWRLNHPDEAPEAGLTDCLDDAADQLAYCFVEWPEKIAPYLPANALVLSIAHHSPEVRMLEVFLQSGYSGS